MKITWLGHSAFLIELEDAVLLFDPFITQNPKVQHLALADIIPKVTHIALTHGHFDHIGDTLAIAKEKEVTVIANSDLGNWLTSQNVKTVKSGNIGGTLKFHNFSLTFTQAIHSSAFLTENNVSLSLGNATGFVLHSKNGPVVYHMGDTDIFGDMALINELHEPEIGLVPIGDCYTMGGAVAALACQRYFAFKTVIPCHYGTFPMLDSTADQFKEAMQGTSTQIIVPEIGQEQVF